MTEGNASAPEQKPPENQPPAGAPPANQQKMVPEADLIGLKKSLEGRIDKLEAEKTAMSLKADQTYQDLLKERAALEQLKPVTQKAADAEKSVSDLKAQLDAATTGRKGLEDQFLEAKRQVLMLKYNVPADSLANKTATQLDTLEEALKLVGAKGPGRNYDLGGASGGAPNPPPSDRIKAGLAELKTKASKTI